MTIGVGFALSFYGQQGTRQLEWRPQATPLELHPPLGAVALDRVCLPPWLISIISSIC